MKTKKAASNMFMKVNKVIDSFLELSEPPDTLRLNKDDYNLFFEAYVSGFNKDKTFKDSVIHRGIEVKSV